MKRRIALAFVLLVAIALLALVRSFSLERSAALPVDIGRFTELVVTIPKGEWRYEPDRLEVARGERFSVRVRNEDDIPHGFALDPYGVLLDVPPHDERLTPTLLATKSGSTTFYCSLMCGEGIVATGTDKGKTRGHFDMEGTFVVIESGE